MKKNYALILGLLVQASLLASNQQNSHGAFPVVTLRDPAPPYLHMNDIPPRLQWDQNFGYCGETSFICAGLYFGQYCSQYTARHLASDGEPQYLPSSQLLLGVNDTDTADLMSLNYDKWEHEGDPSPPQGTTNAFFVWIKQHVVEGDPVIIGVFNNEYLLYGDNLAEEGDPEYDHIIPIIGVGSYSFPIDDGIYHGSDRIYFSDNGLFGAFNVPQFLYNSSFEDFKLNRDLANSPNSPVYSLLDSPDHYGIALLSVYDSHNVTLPVRLKTNVNYEIPEILQGKDLPNPSLLTNSPPPARPLTLTVVISGLTSGTEYNLYLYNDFANVPRKDFNSNPYTQKFGFTATSDTHTMTHEIMSNETAVFRAVPASAP